MKKHKSLLTAIIILIHNIQVFSQSDSTNSLFPIGVPISISHQMVHSARSSVSFQSINLPVLNNASLKEYADSLNNSCINCNSISYYGKGVRNQINLKTSAQYFNSSIEKQNMELKKEIELLKKH